MAELAATAFAAVGTAAVEAAPVALSAGEMAAAGAGAAGVEALPWAAATSVTAAAPAGASMFSSLQGGFSALSMASSMFGGVSGMMGGASQSRLSALDARQAEINAEQESLKIHREYVQRVGAARAGFAASGLDVSSASDIESVLWQQVEGNDALARATGRMRSSVAMGNADAASSRGTGSLVEGIGKAAKTGLDYALDLSRRR